MTTRDGFDLAQQPIEDVSPMRKHVEDQPAASRFSIIPARPLRRVRRDRLPQVDIDDAVGRLAKLHFDRCRLRSGEPAAEHLGVETEFSDRTENADRVRRIGRDVDKLRSSHAATGMLMSFSGSQWTLRWRRQSRANPSLGNGLKIPCQEGKIRRWVRDRIRRKTEPLPVAEGLWHFIPAYSAHAREATGTGATSCVSTGDISIK